MAKIKISQLTAKAANLDNADLLPIAEDAGGGLYITKSVTGQEIIDSVGTVTSVDLTMPSAFTVSGNPITTSGTLAVTGAGVVSQYVRGDGSLANFPSVSGGGASTSYYLNGSVSQGTIGGVTYYEMNKTPILGTGTDFIRTNGAGNGYIASFLTDANDPNLLKIPSGNWNLEFYFSASSSGSSPSFYAELYKYDGTTFTLLASNSANPEGITNGTTIDAYFTALSVPETVLVATDRLAIRVYVTTAGRTITLHTEDNHLCQVITTFTTGLTALNGLTDQVQNLAVGTTGTDFAINSTGSTHTFNLPTASASNRGALSTANWSTFNGKQDALVSGTNIKTINGNSVLGSGNLVIGGGGITVGTTAVASGTIGRVFFEGTGNVVQQSASLFWDNTNSRLGVGATPSTSVRLDVRAQGALSTDIAFRVRNSVDNTDLFSVQGNAITNFGGGTVGGSQLQVVCGSLGWGTNLTLQFASSKSISCLNGGVVETGININHNSNTRASGLMIGSSTGTQVYIDGGQNIRIGQGFSATNQPDANATRTLLMASGVAPTTSPTDIIQMYSADITAGNAAPHFRTENGNIIKLYRETTAVSAATFVTNTSAIANDTATFDGYTIGQVVKALRNLGILA